MDLLKAGEFSHEIPPPPLYLNGPLIFGPPFKVVSVCGWVVWSRGVGGGVHPDPDPSHTWLHKTLTLPQWREGVGRGGGSEAKKNCVPQIGLQFPAPLMDCFFSPRKSFVTCGGVWGGGGGQGSIRTAVHHRRRGGYLP